MMERRKKTVSKSSPLPDDYLKMVGDVFSGHFDEGLKAFNKIRPESFFSANGQIYSDEILMSVSLLSKDQLAATTVYASCDFDPVASSPTAQDLLSICVDAMGSIFGMLLNSEDPDALNRLADESLSALENVPFEWTSISLNKKEIYVKMDKLNPELDQLADQWLDKHDSDIQKEQKKEEEQTKDLFFTGPRSPKETSH